MIPVDGVAAAGVPAPRRIVPTAMQQSMTSVYEAGERRDLHRSVAGALARAFEDDPVSEFLFPNARTRLARLRQFHYVLAGRYAAVGHIFTDDGVRGAAVWQAPAVGAAVMHESLGTKLRLLLVLRRQLARGLAVGEAVATWRPAQPHWYLAVLGTDPKYQGQGVGSALLAPVLRRCDEGRLPVFLESSKETNLPFYRRHGFEVIDTLQIPDGPMLWAMRRDPLSVE